MMKKNELSNAIAVALATSTGLLSGAVAAEEKVLEEVTVTATKRAENLQDVPFAVSALGQEKLDELNIANFDDYIRYLPGVNAAGRGPGQSSIFIRGMATDSSDQTSIEIGAPVPNVALYLDEQPVSSGGRNLDLYAADIARVEVLPGPQGTLFGASSQAGTIRLITNKPVYNEFQAGFDASWSSTSKGDPSNSVEAFVNIPVIDDKFAVRAVFYNAVEGGYIDNVFGENAYLPGMVGFPDGADSVVVNNIAYVEDNFNDAVYRGARISAKIALNDDWEIIPQYMTQSLDVDGVFDHSPPEIANLDVESSGSRVVGDLQVLVVAERFHESLFAGRGGPGGGPRADIGGHMVTKIGGATPFLDSWIRPCTCMQMKTYLLHEKSLKYCYFKPDKSKSLSGKSKSLYYRGHNRYLTKHAGA